MSHILIIILITFVVRNASAANDFNVFELGIPGLMRERNVLDNQLQEVIQHRQEREDQRNDHGDYRSMRIMRVSDELRELRHALERNQDQLIGRHYRAPEERQFVGEQEEFIYEPDADRVNIEPSSIVTLELIDEQEKLEEKILLLEKEEKGINDSDEMSELSYQWTMSKLNEQEAQCRTEISTINKLLKDKKEAELLDNIAIDSLHALENSGVATAEMQDHTSVVSSTSTSFEQYVRDQSDMQQMHDESVQQFDYLEYQNFVNGIPNDDLRDNVLDLRQELANAANLEPLHSTENSGVATAEMQDHASVVSSASTSFEQSGYDDNGGDVPYTLYIQKPKNDVDLFSVHSMEPMKTIRYNSIVSNLQVGAGLELNLNSSLNLRVLLGLSKPSIYGVGIDYVLNKRFNTGLFFMYSYGGSIINGTNAVNIKITESISAFFTEAKYNFPLFNTPATTYISARVGIAQHILKASVMNNNTVITTDDTEDRAFAYGVGIGTEIPINYGVMIGLSYNINNFAFKNYYIDISHALPGNRIAVKSDTTCHSINLLIKAVF